MNYNLHHQVIRQSQPLVRSIFLFGLLSVLVAPGVVGQTTPEIPLRGKPVVEQRVAAAVPPVTATPTNQPPTPLQSLRSAKLIYVRSESILVGQSVIETKLRKRKEFQQLGLMITRDLAAADLIIEVKHDILTKYVFTAVDPRTNVVVASGKLSSLGGTVAGKVAERFMKQLLKARMQSASM